MERKRIGNDLLLRWAIFNKDGSPVDFNGKSVNIQIRPKGSKTGIPQSYIIEENFINLQFTAKEQRKTGIYDLWLQYTWEDPSIEGGTATVTIDNCNAFELVEKSCQLSGINEDPIYLEGVVTGLSYDNLTEENKDEITRRLLESGQFEVDQMIITRAEAAAEEAETQALYAKTQGDDAKEAAEETRTATTNAQTATESANQAADEAHDKAFEAVQAAALANNRAGLAEEKAGIAQTAADNANQAASNAAGAAASANNAAMAANTAKENADTAATGANEAADKANTAAGDANDAAEAANTAAGLADDARLAIQDDLALKANHGYGEGEEPKTLKEVEDNASVKMTNLLQNSSFENGVIEPIIKSDDTEGASTLSINTINPISGNYDARLEVTTPSTRSDRPTLRLNGNQSEWVLNHVFYFGMSVKINSGTPIISRVHTGSMANNLNLTLKDGFNSWTVECTGLTNFALIYLNGTTLWDFNFDNLIAYDLTAIFGAGNEPTKEEMDLLISNLGADYFEGEITIPAQKIMQWQLKDQADLVQLESDLDQLESDVNLFKEESNLKDAIQDSKIKDIESIISTMNPNQSAQLSVSGASPLSLPKNAANGGMSVKMEGVTAENEAVNGDFENGLTDPFKRVDGSVVESTLAINSSTPISGNYDIRLTIITPATGARPIFRGLDRAANIGDKIYLHFYAKILSGTPRIFSISDGRDSNSIYGGDVINGRNTRIIDVEGTGDGLGLIYFSSPSVWDMQMDNFMRINLTETFGAGNEPTKEECDLIFSDYFEGVKSFEPTGRIRSVDASGENPTSLYLTAPELRSNGTVKDEIRKESNGYELVKRVGVGTLGDELITNGTFTTDTSNWTAVDSTLTVEDGSLKITNTTVVVGAAYQAFTTVIGKKYIVKFSHKNGTIHGLLRISHAATGGTNYTSPALTDANATTRYATFVATATTTYIRLLAAGGSTGSTTFFDNVSIKEFTESQGLSIGEIFTEFGSNVNYTLATPIITPISYGGVLNSAENGTVYHEPIIADAGVYSDKMEILLTDYPISAIEEIIKHENGVDTYLNATTAVIAGDGLSFTHPDLASGDLVLFTYAFDKESTNGNITATFYDSNVVKIDTVTGKAYRINEVVTNGVLTRTLTEV